MSNARRFGIVVAALALAVAAFFVFRPADTTHRDDPARTESQAPPSEKSQGGSAEAPPASGSPAGERPPAPPDEVSIRVADGKPVGGPKTVSVKSGDTIRLAFRSDAPGEVHIHGYDRHIDLKPGQTVRTRFPADLEGIFEVEDHATDVLLAKLRVEP